MYWEDSYKREGWRERKSPFICRFSAGTLNAPPLPLGSYILFSYDSFQKWKPASSLFFGFGSHPNISQIENLPLWLMWLCWCWWWRRWWCGFGLSPLHIHFYIWNSSQHLAHKERRERDTRERKYRKRWERDRRERERRDWQKRVSTRRQLYKGMLFRCVLTSLSVSFLSFNLHLQMLGSFVSFSLFIYISVSLSQHGWNSYIYRRKTRKHAVVCP